MGKIFRARAAPIVEIYQGKVNSSFTFRQNPGHLYTELILLSGGVRSLPGICSPEHRFLRLPVEFVRCDPTAQLASCSERTVSRSGRRKHTTIRSQKRYGSDDWRFRPAVARFNDRSEWTAVRYARKSTNCTDFRFRFRYSHK